MSSPAEVDPQTRVRISVDRRAPVGALPWLLSALFVLAVNGWIFANAAALNGLDGSLSFRLILCAVAPALLALAWWPLRRRITVLPVILTALIVSCIASIIATMMVDLTVGLDVLLQPASRPANVLPIQLAVGIPTLLLLVWMQWRKSSSQVGE